MNDRPLNNFDATVLGQMGHIRAVGRKRLRNQNELDDFVQETVARVYANRDQLRDPAKLKQWIAGIARNTANEMNRAAYRRRETPLPNEDELPDMRDPHEQLERAERNDQIRQAMNRLNPIDRDLLQGRYMEEESYADLQERHGLSYSAVGFRLHRAKRRLRKLLTGMKVALALALANMKRTAFGGMLIMTKTTKIVLVAASALILALLGGYLWIEYGGSSGDSEPGLTVEEQSPRIGTGPNAGAADDSSAETKPSDDSEAAQTSEAEEAADNGGAEVTAAQSPDASASAEEPDDFSTQLQEGIQEWIDYANALKTRSPELAPYADMKLRSVEGLAKLDAQLRRQRMELEERREKLLTKYLSYGSENDAEFESSSALVSQVLQDRKKVEPPTKLMTLLQGDMTGDEMTARIMESMGLDFESIDDMLSEDDETRSNSDALLEQAEALLEQAGELIERR